jgi:hypothetical protein
MKLENFTKYNAQLISIGSSSLIGWGLGASINSESLLFPALGSLITGMLGAVVEINILPNLKTVWGTLAIGAVMSAFYPLNAPYLNKVLVENKLQAVPNYYEINTQIKAFKAVDTSSLEGKILSKELELNKLETENQKRLTQIHNYARKTLVENKYDNKSKIKKTYSKWWHKLKRDTGCKISDENSIVTCLEEQAKSKEKSLQDVVTIRNEVTLLKQDLERKKTKNAKLDMLIKKRDAFLNKVSNEVASVEVLGLILFLFGFFIEGGIFSILKGIQIREEREKKEREEQEKKNERETRIRLEIEAREKALIEAKEKKKEQDNFWLELAYNNPTKRDTVSNNIVATLVLAKDQKKSWNEISKYAIWKFNKVGYTTKCGTTFEPLGSTNKNKNKEGVTPQQRAIEKLLRHNVPVEDFSFDDLKDILKF